MWTWLRARRRPATRAQAPTPMGRSHRRSTLSLRPTSGICGRAGVCRVLREDRREPYVLYGAEGERIDGMDRGEVRTLGPEEREACEAEEGVEDVGHVTRAVCDATLLILRCADERCQFLAVYPVHPANGGERGEDPPTVADVGGLLRAPVEAAPRCLSLAE